MPTGGRAEAEHATGGAKRARLAVADADEQRAAALPALTPLAALTPAHARADLVALVRIVLPQGKITCHKNGARVALCVVKLADESDPWGGTSLKLWRARAEWAASALQAGDVLLLTNAVVSQWRDAPVEVSVREYEGSRIRVLTRPETPAASIVLEEELGAILGERAHALVAFATAMRAAQGTQQRRDNRAPPGNNPHAPEHECSGELLTCGSPDPPLRCGNVCGGACEWVRAGQAGGAEEDAGGEEAQVGPQRHGAGMGCNGFQSIAHLVDGPHLPGRTRGKVRVCGILMLSQEGVAACSALLSGQEVPSIPALLSCGIAGQESIARHGAALFCRVIVLGKHRRPLAQFFHNLRLRASGSVWKDQCAAQARQRARGEWGGGGQDEGSEGGGQEKEEDLRVRLLSCACIASFYAHARTQALTPCARAIHTVPRCFLQHG